MEQEEVKDELLPGGDHDRRCAPLCTAGGFLPYLSPLCLLHRLTSPSSLTGDVASAHPASCVWILHPLFSQAELMSHSPSHWCNVGAEQGWSLRIITLTMLEMICLAHCPVSIVVDCSVIYSLVCVVHSYLQLLIPQWPWPWTTFTSLEIKWTLFKPTSCIGEMITRSIYFRSRI